MSRDLGNKYTCFQCGSKFYDLKKTVPVCPKCGADQREAAAAATEKKKKPAPAPVKAKARPEAEDTDDEAEIDPDDESGIEDLPDEDE